MNIIIWDYESVWSNNWPKSKYRSLWPVLQGPVILCCILKRIGSITIIFWDYVIYIHTPGIWSMLKGYIVVVGSVCLFICLSILPSVHLWFHPLTLCLTRFYFEVFWLLIIAATDQKLFIFGMRVPGRVLFHSASMNPWVVPKGGGQRSKSMTPQ